MGETALEVTEAVFGNNQFIYVEAEKMRVISGGGTTTLHVERGVDGTSTGYHPSGVPVISAYNYTNLVVQPIDVDSTSVETAWITLGLNQASLDGNTPGQSLNLGDKNYDNIMSFWRRVAVPPSTPVQNKTDLRLRIVGVEHPAYMARPFARTNALKVAVGRPYLKEWVAPVNVARYFLQRFDLHQEIVPHVSFEVSLEIIVPSIWREFDTRQNIADARTIDADVLLGIHADIATDQDVALRVYSPWLNTYNTRQEVLKRFLDGDLSVETIRDITLLTDLLPEVIHDRSFDAATAQTIFGGLTRETDLQLLIRNVLADGDLRLDVRSRLLDPDSRLVITNTLNLDGDCSAAILDRLRDLAARQRIGEVIRREEHPFQ